MIEYITVSELAKREKITKQQAYKLLETDEYRNRIIRENGITKIRCGKEEPKETKETPKEETKKTIENSNTAYIEHLEAEIRTLKDLNKQLLDTIAEKDKLLRENNDKIINLLEKQQELTEKAIHTTAQQQYIQAKETQTIEDSKAEVSESKGFFSRLFRNI